MAIGFAERNLENEAIGKFMIEVDRLKSKGNLSDYDILIKAFQEIEK